MKCQNRKLKITLFLFLNNYVMRNKNIVLTVTLFTFSVMCCAQNKNMDSFKITNKNKSETVIWF